MCEQPLGQTTMGLIYGELHHAPDHAADHVSCTDWQQQQQQQPLCTKVSVNSYVPHKVASSLLWCAYLFSSNVCAAPCCCLQSALRV